MAVAGSATCAVASIVTGLASAANPAAPGLESPTTLLAAGIVAIPGFIAAGPLLPGQRLCPSPPAARRRPCGRLLQSTELALAGVTPVIALLTASSSYLIVFLLWDCGDRARGQVHRAPARQAREPRTAPAGPGRGGHRGRASASRGGHPRRRAPGRPTLLVRRLDAAGDTEGADIARTAFKRLRAICGDLRLPILDDLGVGPALDWLVLRIERLAGGEVRLERADGTRPPADVVVPPSSGWRRRRWSNAVKHGRPPITVRYRLQRRASPP